MKPSAIRVPVLVLALIPVFAVTVWAGGQPGAAATTAGERKILEYSTISTRPEVVERPSLFEEYVLEKFGIKFNYEDMAAADTVEKLNLLFATGEAPDVILTFNVYSDSIKRWGLEGVLVPMSDHMDKLPAYRKLFGDAEWDFMVASTSSSDGRLYWLPPKQLLITGYSYIWRKGSFDKMGLTFPMTTGALHDTLKAIKRDVPDSIPYSSRSGVGWLMDGFYLPFRTSRVWLVDPDTAKLEFGPVTDKGREALKYVNKLYADGLIEPEFPTATTQTWTERFAQGLPYFQFSYAGRADWANNTMRDADPNAAWAVSHEMLVADPGKEQLHSRRGYGVSGSSGPVINSQISQEKLDRLLEYFNWAATEEGRTFHAFGVEGKTFEYVNGKPKYMSHVYSLENPEGTDMIYFGFTAKEMDGFLVAGNREALAQRQGPVYTDLCSAMEDKPYIRDQIAWTFTTDQEDELADLDTVIADVWAEYATKFILGKLDPNNDAHWNEFIQTINKSGLAREKEIRGSVFKDAKVY